MHYFFSQMPLPNPSVESCIILQHLSLNCSSWTIFGTVKASYFCPSSICALVQRAQLAEHRVLLTEVHGTRAVLLLGEPSIPHVQPLSRSTYNLFSSRAVKRRRTSPGSLLNCLHGMPLWSPARCAALSWLQQLWQDPGRKKLRLGFFPLFLWSWRVR